MSQNCVCSNCPPGALKQQVFVCAVVLWQLSTPGRGQETELELLAEATFCGARKTTWAAPKANLARERREGIVSDREEFLMFPTREERPEEALSTPSCRLLVSSGGRRFAMAKVIGAVVAAALSASYLFLLARSCR